MTSKRTRLAFNAVPRAASIAIAAVVIAGWQPVARADERKEGDRFATWESSLEGVHGTSGDFTVRNVSRASIAGTRIRVRISNAYGTSSITIKAASIGLQQDVAHPALLAGSLRTLTFNEGQTSVNIRAGEAA